MKVEQDLHMANGDGENSYATNSRLQEKAIVETRPVLQDAVAELYASLCHSHSHSHSHSPGRRTMVVADLGCSSGPNTLLLVSEVIGAVSDCGAESAVEVEVQFFLNDLPGNDFNLVFRSLDRLKKLAGGAVPPLYYVAGQPGSFYTRLFPSHSVHLFHSSFSLMWRSKVSDELSKGIYLNEGSMYIGKTTPPAVIRLYQDEFRKDFSSFLTLRFKELVSGGRMVLTFIGRKSNDLLSHGDVSSIWDLLAQAIMSLGDVEKEKLISFNLPFYAPSVDEVKAVIAETEVFNVERIGLFESSWDPFDDGDDEVVDCAASGANVGKCIRAVLEPLVREHFGDAILDRLFRVYAGMVAKHLQKGKAKYPIIVVSLKARH